MEKTLKVELTKHQHDHPKTGSPSAKCKAGFSPIFHPSSQPQKKYFVFSFHIHCKELWKCGSKDLCLWGTCCFSIPGKPEEHQGIFHVPNVHSAEHPPTLYPWANLGRDKKKKIRNLPITVSSFVSHPGFDDIQIEQFPPLC